MVTGYSRVLRYIMFCEYAANVFSNSDFRDYRFSTLLYGPLRMIYLRETNAFMNKRHCMNED